VSSRCTRWPPTWPVLKHRPRSLTCLSYVCVVICTQTINFCNACIKTHIGKASFACMSWIFLIFGGILSDFTFIFCMPCMLALNSHDEHKRNKEWFSSLTIFFPLHYFPVLYLWLCALNFRVFVTLQPYPGCVTWNKQTYPWHVYAERSAGTEIRCPICRCTTGNAPPLNYLLNELIEQITLVDTSVLLSAMGVTRTTVR
jgi:hypothetical protein